MTRLYGDIAIEVVPYAAGFSRNKWRASTKNRLPKPYQGWGGSETVNAWGKTSEEAVEKLKNKLCKITAREEKRHAEHQRLKAGIKETFFNRDQDCNSVIPRPKLFE
jgi:hypothetical protein